MTPSRCLRFCSHITSLLAFALLAGTVPGCHSSPRGGSAHAESCLLLQVEPDSYPYRWERFAFDLDGARVVRQTDILGESTIGGVHQGAGCPFFVEPGQPLASYVLVDPVSRQERARIQVPYTQANGHTVFAVSPGLKRIAWSVRPSSSLPDKVAPLFVCDIPYSPEKSRTVGKCQGSTATGGRTTTG